MFFLVVLAHTDEQYNNLLNTRELIIVINVRLSTGILRDLFDKGYLYISKGMPCANNFPLCQRDQKVRFDQ